MVLWWKRRVAAGWDGAGGVRSRNTLLDCTRLQCSALISCLVELPAASCMQVLLQHSFTIPAGTQVKQLDMDACMPPAQRPLLTLRHLALMPAEERRAVTEERLLYAVSKLEVRGKGAGTGRGFSCLCRLWRTGESCGVSALGHLC